MSEQNGCCGEHEHHGENRTLLYVRIFIALFLGIFSYLSFVNNIMKMIILGVAYLIIGYDVIYGSVMEIIDEHKLGERFLMTIASLGAFAIGEYVEAVAVMLFYQVGELLEDIAVDKSRDAISELSSIRADKIRLIAKDGSVSEVSPETVVEGDEFEVRAGELIAVDGVIVSGSGNVDTAALTGESLPVFKKENDSVLGGSINLGGLLRVRASSEYSCSTVAKILKLVEESESRKSNTESFVKKFAAIYTPIVVCLALIVAFVVPFIVKAPLSRYIYRALVFLTVSCPCAFVISVPLAYFAGIGGASRSGILIKGAGFIDLLAKADLAVFDKTGTLTDGTFKITGLTPARGVPETELLYAACAAECQSNHPIAKALCAYGGFSVKPDSVTEIPGKGMLACLDGQWFIAGNSSLMSEWLPRYKKCTKPGTVVYVGRSGKYLGCIRLESLVKESASEALVKLSGMSVKSVMLTGDNDESAKLAADKLGISEYKASLLPADKVTAFEEYAQTGEGSSIFVGDGINDAPVLTAADVGIAMGGVGSDAAIEAADVVIMDDDINHIPKAIEHSKRVKSIVLQNIVITLSVKVIVMLLGLFGYMWLSLSVIADVGVCLVAVANSLRALKK